MEMLQFRPYPSIGNHTDPVWMERVRSSVSANTLFAVQEKVHGVNAAFLCDDLDIRMARRRAVLSPGEPFHGWEDLLERDRGAVYFVYNLLKRRLPGLCGLLVYGEIFGGSYPHPGVPADPLSVPVQRGVHYCPGHAFYVFDIYALTEAGGDFLPVEEVTFLCRGAGLLFARTLFTGTLEECLDYPCAFPTTLPAEFDLPPLKDNLCEGIVIKPLIPLYLPEGERIAVKVRNPGFPLSGGTRRREKGNAVEPGGEAFNTHSGQHGTDEESGRESWRSRNCTGRT